MSLNELREHHGVTWDGNYNFELKDTNEIIHYGGNILVNRTFTENDLIYLDCSSRINFNKPNRPGRIKGAPANFKSLFNKVAKENISELCSDLIKQIGYPQEMIYKKYLKLGSNQDLRSVVNNIRNIAIIKLHYGAITKMKLESSRNRSSCVSVTNIKDPKGFSLRLAELFKDFYKLFEIVKEREILPEITEPPEWPGDTGKTCFQVSGQFERPHDFFVTLLDLIRVTYEPTFFGTFFLNANWGFLLQEITESPFRLGYLTAISEPSESVASLFARSIKPQMQQYNYSFDAANAIFVMASFSKDRFSIELMVEVNELFGSGFSVDDALGTIAGELKGESYQKPISAYSGFSIDNSLGEKLRLSLWLFLPHLQ